jgi:NAD-dependent dihydropyrimidine dehydrogenase PreA subunit
MKKNKIIGIAFLCVLLAMIVFNSCEKYNETYAVNADKCSLCKQCIAVCGQHAITYVEGTDSTAGSVVIDRNKCVACGKCAQACSSNAIYTDDE